MASLAEDHDILKLGALEGAYAWIAYAVAECFFRTILPWTTEHEAFFSFREWIATAELFAIYGTAGLAIGAVGTALRRTAGLHRMEKADADGVLQAPGVLALVWALAISLDRLSPNDKAGIAIRLSVAAIVTVALGLQAISRSGGWGGRLSANGWTVSFFLLGLPYIDHKWLTHHATMAKAAAGLGYLLLIAGFAALARTATKHRVSRLGLAEGGRKLGCAGAAAVLALSGTAVMAYLDDGVAGGAGVRKDRPNVILITLDTVRADHLSLYGYEKDTTPYLKKLAERATLYTSAFAPSDMTLPSHASLFTGLYARRHGAHYSSPHQHTANLSGFPLADKFPTLAGILERAGYQTAGVAANGVFLGHEFRLDRGFGDYVAMRDPDPAADMTPYFLCSSLDGLGNLRTLLPPPGLHKRAEIVNRYVFPRLTRLVRQGRPFFLFINYMDAHEPYAPPPPFDALFPGKDPALSPAEYSSLMWQVNGLAATMSPEQRAHAISQYDGSLAYLDVHLQRLFDRLRELGAFENTLLIVTSDHGEAFGERNLAGHGGLSVYQDLVHIPLLIRYPGETGAAASSENVSLVDILPTVLEQTGIERPKNLDGRSLLSKEAPAGPVISETYPGLQLMRLHRRFQRVERALYSGSWKLIRSTAGKHELYNLQKDGGEEANLYLEEGSVARSLEATLDDWLRGEPEENPAPFQPDRETIQRLKSLGYIQ